MYHENNIWPNRKQICYQCSFYDSQNSVQVYFARIQELRFVIQKLEHALAERLTFVVRTNQYVWKIPMGNPPAVSNILILEIPYKSLIYVIRNMQLKIGINLHMQLYVSFPLERWRATWRKQLVHSSVNIMEIMMKIVVLRKQ